MYIHERIMLGKFLRNKSVYRLDTRPSPHVRARAWLHQMSQYLSTELWPLIKFHTNEFKLTTNATRCGCCKGFKKLYIPKPKSANLKLCRWISLCG